MCQCANCPAASFAQSVGTLSYNHFYHFITLSHFDYGNHRHYYISHNRYWSSSRLYERFRKAVGFFIGADCRPIRGKGVVRFCCRESVLKDYRLCDTGTSIGIYRYLDSRTFGFYSGSVLTDKGDGSHFIRIAEPFAGCRTGSAQVPSTGELADRCPRIYRLR